MNTSMLLRTKAIENCKTICKYMGQSEELHKEKFNRFIKDVEHNTSKDIAYMAPEEFYRLVYNESIKRVEQFKPII